MGGNAVSLLRLRSEKELDIELERPDTVAFHLVMVLLVLLRYEKQAEYNTVGLAYGYLMYYKAIRNRRYSRIYPYHTSPREMLKVIIKDHMQAYKLWR